MPIARPGRGRPTFPLPSSLEKYKVKYTIKEVGRGPAPQWIGADEVDYYQFRTKELAEWMHMREEEEKKEDFDKIFMGYATARGGVGRGS